MLFTTSTVGQGKQQPLTGANADRSQGQTTKAVNMISVWFYVLLFAFHFFHNASLMHHKRYDVFRVGFPGTQRAGSFAKSNCKLGKPHQCIPREDLPQYLMVFPVIHVSLLQEVSLANHSP